jgi:SAM-dependent methyltransferase
MGEVPIMSIAEGSWQARYLQHWYGSRPGWIGGTAQFHVLIARHLPAAAEILELGPGTKSRTSDFLRQRYPRLDGLDVDEDARKNPALHHVYIYKGDRWPIEDQQYDALVADYVLEHLATPLQTMSEAYRVLRPEGMFFFRTPNLLHYTALVSCFSPHWVHLLLANRLRKLPPGTHEPYPTYYRMNRHRVIRSILRRARFEEVELLSIEKEPAYGMASRALFFLFMAYELVVNSSGLFGMLRANWLGAFRKPGILP